MTLKELSIVIPIRENEDQHLSLVSFLKAFEPDLEIQIIKGSNRAKQMNEGARNTKKSILWFLHADSKLDKIGIEKLIYNLKRDTTPLYYFNLKFDSPLLSFLTINTIGANFRSQILNLPFGDQGLCISKENFIKVGGFDEKTPYGEDLLFVRQALKKGIHLKCVEGTITTSPRKYKKNGWLRTTAKHLFLTYELVQKSNRKSGAIAIFVKTPGLSPVKTRLATKLGKDKAEAVYFKLLELTEKIVKETADILGLVPYWAVAEKEAAGHPLWNKFEIVSQGEGDLGDRLFNVYDTLIKKHEIVFLVGADCPEISIKHFKAALKALNSADSVIGRTEDGGFYLFGGKKVIEKEIWKKVPYSAVNTAEKLIENLKPESSFEEIEVLRDLDTFEDYEKFSSMPQYSQYLS